MNKAELANNVRWNYRCVGKARIPVNDLAHVSEEYREALSHILKATELIHRVADKEEIGLS